jgi:DNA polymerase-3 subunit delta
MKREVLKRDFSLSNMFILIYGKDNFRARQKLKEIVQKYQKGAQLGLFSDILSSGDLRFQDFKDELWQSPMFKEPRIIILRNAFSNLEFKTEFVKQSKNLAGGNDNSKLFIFCEEKDSFLTNDLLNFFKKQGKIYKYDFLTGADLGRWVKKEISGLGTDISPSALALLAKSVGSDLWRMSSEIKKLAAYKSKGKKIEKEDVELLVKPEIEAAIFKTIDAIAAKNKKIALTLIYRHLEKGDSPLYLLSMINYQFRNLLLVKDFEGRPFAEIIAALKPMHHFVVRKSSWLAKKFSREQLEEIYLKLFKMDLAVKTGKIKPEMALELLIADM